MKKISLQTKLEDCSVPQRYIDVIKRGAEDIRIIFDIVSLTRPDFMRIRIVGKRCLSIWQEFLEEYGLHLGMTVKEILQYDPDGILQYDPDSGKLQYKLISSLNCYPESNIDWSKREKFDPKTLKPFDRVLVRNYSTIYWNCDFFSRIDDSTSNHEFITISSAYRFCIPYNDETKHLVGTTEEAPEFYRYWED